MTMQTKVEKCQMVARLAWHGFNVHAIAARLGLPVDVVASYRSAPECRAEMERLAGAARASQNGSEG